MRHKILECALGTVYLECVYNIYQLSIPDNPAVSTVAGPVRQKEEKLPGGKFTAREFLQEYVEADGYAQIGQAIMDVRGTGTWHFPPEAVKMAEAALEEWGK